MSYERSKAPLALMEQIIMILVFALAAAICLQAFVYSNHLSKTGEQRELAVTKAQQVTEYCKAKHGNLDNVSKALGGVRTSDGLKISYQDEEMDVVLRVTESNSYMEKATVTVMEQGGSEIYSMEIAWQRRGIVDS